MNCLDEVTIFNFINLNNMFKKVITILFFLALATSNFDAFAQKTTIWLVRHAEKQAADAAQMNSSNPDLSAIGVSRAAALAKVLKPYPLNTIYSTNYKRTLATATPLAAQLKLTPVVYDARDLTVIATKALQENKGRQALIVGHSNTLIPVIKALNAEVPFAELTDNDYDMLFKVVIDENGKAKLTIGHYGDAHHTTDIPPAYSETFIK